MPLRAERTLVDPAPPPPRNGLVRDDHPDRRVQCNDSPNDQRFQHAVPPELAGFCVSNRIFTVGFPPGA